MLPPPEPPAILDISFIIDEQSILSFKVSDAFKIKLTEEFLTFNIKVIPLSNLDVVEPANCLRLLRS